MQARQQQKYSAEPDRRERIDRELESIVEAALAAEQRRQHVNAEREHQHDGAGRDVTENSAEHAVNEMRAQHRAVLADDADQTGADEAEQARNDGEQRHITRENRGRIFGLSRDAVPFGSGSVSNSFRAHAWRS